MLSREEAINDPAGFWVWFKQHEQKFHKAVKSGKEIERDFFNHLSPRLNQLHKGIYYVTGMFDDHTVELVFTPEGIIENVVFCEELANAAPNIAGWKFTALKSPMSMKDIDIKLQGYSFTSENIGFYVNEIKEYPDEINIILEHKDYNQQNKDIIKNGCFLFLDNLLGELKVITLLDQVSFVSPGVQKGDFNGIEKLDSYITWREKEFVEKHTGKRYNTENDSHSLMEAELEDGTPVIAIMNSELLNWDAKASHSWMAIVEFNFKGNNGMPDEKLAEEMDRIEDEIMKYLKDEEGYLNVGRETGQNKRTIFFACAEFRKPSIVLTNIVNKYKPSIKINFEMFRDKYWRSLSQFIPE